MNFKTTKKIKYNPKKRKPYFFRVYVGNDEATGSAMHRQQSFDTYDEALQALLKLDEAIKNGTFCVSPAKRYKYSDLVSLWLSQYKPSVKPSTYATVHQLVNTHILPELGRFYLDKLSVLKCQKVVNKWAEDYPKSYNRIFVYARKILDYGWRMELIKANPMKKVIKPRPHRKPKEFANYYSKEELIDFLNACKNYDSLIYYTYFKLLAYTGLRPSEALALKWSDINRFNKTLSVSRTVDTKEHNQIIIDTPKTNTSIRTIDLDDNTLTMLLEWKKMTGKVARINSDYIFYNPNRPEGVFVRQDARRWDHKIATDNHLRYISPHGFRHTHASIMFSAGVQAKDVQERLGHSTISTTLDLYVHLGKERKRKTISKLEEFMEA